MVFIGIHKQIIEKIDPNKIRVAVFGLVFGLNLYAFFSGTMTYGMNDDIGMMRIANGMFGRTYSSPYLIFTHIFIGYLLDGMYQFFPAIEWYTVYTLSTYVVLSMFLLYYLSKILTAPLATIVGAIGLIFFFLYAARNIQFTINAFMAGTLAILSFFYYNKPGHKKWKKLSIPLGFLFLSFLIRYPACLATMAFSVPLYLFAYYKHRSQLIYSGVLLLLSMLGIFLLQEVNDKIYRTNKEWSEYHSYNRIRGKIHDDKGSIPPENLKEKLESIGWTVAEYRLFFSWYFLDKDSFSKEKLTKLLALRKKESIHNQFNVHSLFKFIEIKKIYFLFVIVTVFPLFIPVNARFLMLVLLFYFFAIILFMATVKMPDRVLIPILFNAIITQTLLFQNQVENKN